MKCSKCGFVSFDYLSECRKCGTNLVGVRDALGFGAAKPAVPPFLEKLLDGYVPPESKEEKDLAADGELRSLDFEENYDAVEFNVPQDDTPRATAAQSGGASPEHGDAGEFNLFELSDADLDLAIDEGDNPAIEAPSEVDAQAESELELELEPLDLEPRLDDELKLELDGEEEVSETPARQAVPGNEPLVVELSENELENLLSELEKSSTGGEEVGSKGSSDRKPQ